jgi:hypothetical protein
MDAVIMLSVIRLRVPFFIIMLSIIVPNVVILALAVLFWLKTLKNKFKFKNDTHSHTNTHTHIHTHIHIHTHTQMCNYYNVFVLEQQQKMGYDVGDLK